MRSATIKILIAALFPAGTAVAEGSPEHDSPPESAFSAAVLADFPTDAWPTNGGDIYNRRYSPLTDITRENISDLKAVWRTHLEGSGLGPQYSGQAQPLVYEGIIYIVTGAHDVFAVRVETGEVLWSYKPEINDDLCCRWTSRGLALGDGMVFLARLDARLIALDQQTGEVVWNTQVKRWQEGYTITSAPLYYDGRVITGFSGAEFGVRGQVKAYDARDGSPLWTFNTVPGPGEFGHDTWPEKGEAWKRGGATVWQTPAVDPELDLLYFSTSNPSPNFNGAVREGDNLFSTSIVAIEADTGDYRWHYQQVHHDIWDLDAANPVVLFDMELNGKSRKAIVQVGKTGWAYILDRESGKPLHGIEEKPVMQEPRQLTSPTQPFPKGEPIAPLTMDVPPEGFELINDGHTFTPYWTEPVVTRRVGTNWPPSAYDPRTQTLFVCAREYLFSFNADANPEIPPTGERYYGGSFGGLPFSNGLLVALDMNTNSVIWNQRWDEPCYSGITATAGNLLFIGRNDGRLTAVDSGNGKRLWEFRTDAGVNAPVSIFEHKDEQYLTVLSAGNTFVGSERGDSLWLFALSGDMGEDMIDQSAAATEADGETLYASTCAFCHGEEGEGGRTGVSLTRTDKNEPGVIRRIIREGSRGIMPAFEGTLNSNQIKAVAAHIVHLQQRQ